MAMTGRGAGSNPRCAAVSNVLNFSCMAIQHSLIGTGMYPLTRAAQLVGEEARTVRRWLDGYTWTREDGQRSSGPLWQLQYATDGVFSGELVLGFQDLLELRTVARFVEQGVPLRTIRATIDLARESLGDYPLHSRRFVTDGRKIFLEAVERAGEDAKLLDIQRRQFVMDAVIRPSLLEGIEYEGEDGASNASRWFPDAQTRVIVLDPKIQFGEPIIAASGVPTDALAAAYRAEGENAKRVARLFDVSPDAVRAAVDFENRLAA